MTKIDKNKPVMVTGASGYVGSWIVYKLLEQGYTVHGTVRDPKKPTSVDHLNKMAEKLDGTLKLFKADLLNDGSFFDAMQDCEVVLHTASPFLISNITDPVKQLIEPAVAGTQNVLNSVNNTPSVKRVVLTSSVAAIYGDSIDIKKTKKGVFTDENWNKSSREDHQPYQYSKTMAEKAAWQVYEDQKNNDNAWDLVVINPGLIMGKALTSNSVSGSIDLLKQFASGIMRFGAPSIYISLVDVQNVADAHINAAFTPEANGRYILVDKCLDFVGMNKVLAKQFPKYPLPKRKFKKLAFWLIAPLIGQKREMIKKNVNYKIAFDNSRSQQDLGIKYIPIEESIIGLFQSMIDNGIIKDKT